MLRPASSTATPPHSCRFSLVVRFVRPHLLLAATAAVALLAASDAKAQTAAISYFWTGTSAGGPIWTSISGGSNWSLDPNSVSDPANAPGSANDVFFVFNPELNASATTLGQDITIKGLFITPDASSPVGIGGANTLTIGSVANGTDGIVVAQGAATTTVSSNLAIGGAQTWADNATSSTTSFTVNGVISGSAALQLQGTGSSTAPSGAFVFGGNNSYTGAITLFNNFTSLTLNGNGSLTHISGLTFNGGTSLTLDNTSAAATRLSSTLPITSNGATITVLGNSMSAVAENFGALTLGSGQTNINLGNVGAGGTTLTIGSVVHTVGNGGTINYSPSTGSIVLTNPPTLVNNIIGGWATISNPSNTTGGLDFATVNGSNQVIPLPAASYNTVSFATTPWAATDNVQTSETDTTTGTTLPNSPTTINSLYLTGNAVIQFAGALRGANNTLVIGSGGIISSGATGSLAVSDNKDLTNLATIGGVAGEPPAGPGNNSPSTSVNQFPGNVTSSTGELLVTTTATSNLRINNTITDDGAISVSLIKSGAGILDLSNANSQGNNGTAKSVNSYTGITVVNGGTLVINAIGQLGPTGTAKTNRIILNGGELKTFATITVPSQYGITLGPQGGTFSYQGGSTTVLQNPITGAGGGFVLASIGYANFDQIDLNPAANYTYSGPTTFQIAAPASQGGSAGSITLRNLAAAVNALPPTTALTITGAQGANPDYSWGIFNLFSHNLTVGSLAGDGRIVNSNNGAATLTVGGNNLSTTFNGLIGETGITDRNGTQGTMTTNISLVKTGTGIFTISGNPISGTPGFANGGGQLYTGTTTVNLGGLNVMNTGLTVSTSAGATGSGAVTVNGTSATSGGSLGGSGTITGPVTINNFGNLSPTLLGSGTTTLHLSNNLTLNAGSILDFNLGNLSTDPSDLVNVGGTLNVAATPGATTDTINVTSVNHGMTTGLYTLISAASTNYIGTNFTVNGPLQFIYHIQENAGLLQLQVTNNPNPLLTWNGAPTPGNGTWDLNSSNMPWSLTAGGGSSAYSDGAFLTFDNTPNTTATIAIPNNVAPGSMTFNNNVLVPYTFNGPGQITGTIGFTKKNSGTVTFNNTNTFTGIANITNGTVVVGAGGSLSDASYVVAGGANLTVNGSLAASAITNQGALAVGSTGALDPTTTLSNLNLPNTTSASATFSNAAQTLATISGNGSITLTGTALTISGTSQYDGAIGGTGSIITGANGTTLTLTQANTYGGGTNILAGTTLTATNTTGSATGTGTTTVSGTLTGTGAIGGPIVVNAGGTMRVSGANTWGSSVAVSGTLSPFGAGVAGSINLGGTTVSNGATLSYDFGNLTTSDTASVPSLTTSGAVTLNVNGLPGFGANVYPLFTSTAAISDSATYTIVPQGALAGFPLSYFSVTHDSTHVFLNVNFTNPTTVIWRGTASSNWNTTESNWSPNPMFANGNVAQFDDSNTSGRTTIAVDAAGINPLQTIFNNSSAGPDPTYTINGGALGGVLLSMTGTGTAILSNPANGILGQTSITNGSLQIAADGSLGPAPVTAIANQLVINGGELRTLATTTLATTRGIQIGNAAGHIGAAATTGATINVDTTAGANVTTYNGIIADVAGQTGILNKAGAGELDLGGANTFSGGMNINAGGVKLTASGAGGTGRITVNANGALSLANDVPVTVPTAPAVLTPPIATPITMNGGVLGSSGNGAVHVIQSDMTIATGTTATIDLFDPLGPADAATNRSETILGVQNLTSGVQTSAYGTLHGSGNIFVQQQTGVTTPDNQGFRLRGAASTDYTGTITVGQGAKFEVQNSTGTPGSPAGTGLIVLTGGTINSLLTTAGGGPGTTGSFSLFNVRNNFTVTPAAPTTVTFGNNVSITGTGDALMNMLGTAAAGSTIAFGSLRIGGQQALDELSNSTAGQILSFTSVTLNGGGNATFIPEPAQTAKLQNTGYTENYPSAENMVLGPIGENTPGSGIIMAGAATLTLTTANTYTGPTIMQGAPVYSLGANNNLQVAQSGTLLLGAPGALPAGTALTVSGGTVDFNNNGTSNDQTVGSLTDGNSQNGIITNSDAANTRTLTINQASLNTTFSGSIRGNLNLTLSNNGTLNLQGANSYTGNTTISGGGVLTVIGASPNSNEVNLGAVPVVATPGSLTINNGTLATGPGAPQTLTMSPTRGIALGSGGGTIDVAPGVALSVAGIIANAPSQVGALHVVDSGQLLLSGASTYSVGTTVTDTTLGVTNVAGSATGTGNVSLSSTATLVGIGAISGAVTLNGTLAPGLGASSTGTLNLGPTNINSSAVLNYDMAGPGASDLTNVGGLAAYGGAGVTVNINGLTGLALGTYNLVTATSHSGALPTLGNVNSPNAAYTYALAFQGNNLVLKVGNQPGGIVAQQTWTNGAATGLWNTADANWTGAATHYADNSFLEVFDDTAGAANGTVNIPSPVSPLGVLFANSAAVTYTISTSTASGIGGNGAVVIQGPGTVNLNTPNSYQGGTTLLGGTLNIGDQNALGFGTFIIAGGTFDNPGPANIGQIGTVPLIWSGSFTFTGSNDLNLGFGNVTLETNPTVTVGAHTLTVGGPIGDAGAGYGFTKAGNGTLVLASANTYSGTTTLSAGGLTISSPGTLGGGTAPLTVLGGTLDLGGTTQTVGPVNVSGGTFQSTGGNGTLSSTSFTFNNAGPVTIPSSVILAGTGGLTKTAAGTLTLGAVNTYTGTTTLSSGGLTIVAPGRLGATTAPLTVNGGTLDLGATTQTVGPVNITAGTFQSTGGNGTLNSTSFTVNDAGAVTIPPSVILAGTGALNKQGAGTLSLGPVAPNTYSGGTTITGGVLSIAGQSTPTIIAPDSNLGAVPAAATANSITLNGGTLSVMTGTAANAGANNNTIKTNRGITLGASGGTIDIRFGDTVSGSHNGTEIALTYNGVITGTGNLTVTGLNGINQTQASILDISAIQTYGGTTTFSNAVGEVNSGNSGANNGAAVVNILPTGTTLNLINNGAWVIDSSTSGLTVAGITGDSTGRAGTINGSSASAYTVSGAGNYLFAGVIGPVTLAGKTGGAGAISLTKNGTGTQTLSGVSTYTGATNVNNGTLATTSTGKIGNGPVTVSAATGANAVLSLGFAGSQPVTSLAGTVAGTGTARVNIASGTTLTDTQTTSTTFAGNVVLAAGATPPVGNTPGNGGALTMNGAAGVLEIQGAPTLNNNSSLNVSAGKLRFNVTPTSSGTVSVGSGVLATVTGTATLELAGSVSALSTSAAVADRVNVVNNSTSASGLLVSGTNQKVGNIDGTGTTQVNASSSLTANHIVQTALVIGGDATHVGLVTIGASDASGNPLAASGEGALAVANSISPSDPFGSSGSNSSSLASDAGGSSDGAASLGGSSAGGGSAAVPEPSTMALVAVGLALLGSRAICRRRA